VWGLRWEGLGTRGHANASAPSHGAWFFETVLDRLELSEGQANRIHQILAANMERIGRLEDELLETRRALRAAAGSSSFDEELAGQIVRHRAEIAAYLWGTQARVESQVFQTLTPEQRLAYSELRALDELESYRGY
jgi:Spy/CpxP family protein refolding chaperone